MLVVGHFWKARSSRSQEVNNTTAIGSASRTFLCHAPRHEAEAPLTLKNWRRQWTDIAEQITQNSLKCDQLNADHSTTASVLLVTTSLVTGTTLASAGQASLVTASTKTSLSSSSEPSSVRNWSLLMHCSSGADVIVVVVVVVRSCLSAVARSSTFCWLTSRVLPPPITLRSAWWQRHRNTPAEVPQCNPFPSRCETTAP